MKLNTRLLGLPIAAMATSAVILAGATAASAAPAGTAAPQQTTAATSATTSPVTVPVTGTFTDALGGVGQVTGTFTPTSFANQGGQLVATGTLVATLTNSVGTVLGTVTQTVTQAVTAPASSTGTCQVLTLNLGPLHLNLLGLVVDLAPVNLNITAQQAPGALLGNLLCAVTHLLDSGAPTGSVANLLNQILALL